MFRYSIYFAMAALPIALKSFGTIIMLDLPHDELSVRETIPQAVWIQKEKMLDELERELLEGCETKEDVIKRFGEPVQPKPDSKCRPVGGEWIINPEDTLPEDRKYLMKRSAYFQIGSQAVVLVFFGADGRVYRPSALYLLVDSEFHALTHFDRLEPRLRWETRVVERLCREVAIDETELRTARVGN